MKRKFVSLVVCLAFLALLAVPAGIASGGTVEPGLNYNVLYASAPGYNLTVNATNGSVTRDPDLEEYPPGTKVTLTAVPDPGYYFFGWSGDASGTTNPVTIIMNADKTVFAQFDTLHVDFITPNKLGNGCGNRKAQVKISGQGFLPSTGWPCMRVWIEKKYPNNKLIKRYARYVVVSDSNTIDCILNVSYCIPGAWDVVVWKPTRPIPEKATLTGGLTVTQHPFNTIPAVVYSGRTGDSVCITINGDYYQEGVKVKLWRYFDPPIEANNIEYVSSKEIKCCFDLSGAHIGTWRVIVTNPDGGVGTPYLPFRVLPAL